VGAILQRADRRAARENIAPTEDLHEVREIVQEALEKVRSLSQALHPAVLDEAGLESALAAYLPGFEQRTGIVVEYVKSGENRALDKEASIHLYRVVQEALSNVVRHSKSPKASVRLRFNEAAVVIEIEDEGLGYPNERPHGLGLVSMRERADLVNGSIEFLRGNAGGALVRATAPYREVEIHATD
jgi:signal transduction histidine kinase